MQPLIQQKSLASYSWASVGSCSCNASTAGPISLTQYQTENIMLQKESEGFASKMGGKIQTFWGNAYDISKLLLNHLDVLANPYGMAVRLIKVL